MRVYLPATFSILKELKETGSFHARSGWGFAVTPALVEFFEEGDEEEFAHFAFIEAARASLRLLAIGDETAFPHRRVVITADLPDSQVTLAPENGEAVVALSPAQINFDDVAALHVDVESSESATAAAIAAIDAADLGDEDAELTVGDADDNFMAWYDTVELPFLVDLL
ncbi:hypothetical protein HW450_04220 [Corynebacterium hindlerae]|uniref:Uncharacterized protein n=1 Tax=Corynebacterium hindlerae TaxID=699041 RepID=A0A7G5FH42_9CORY|nr:hypothetical protein [Corynebacterium hindlerae]QMV85933.1 hypothetical protein HW450_04220 [Corynebacterium hindlerae]QTH60416.1 hypothetical protein J5O04_04640 [Corynebacterium hindlerae]